jgi:hypothetical protein
VISKAVIGALTTTLVALTTAVTARTSATLSQTNRVGATLHGAARCLTNTTDGIGGALQGLAEEANNVRHFY